MTSFYSRAALTISTLRLSLKLPLDFLLVSCLLSEPASGQQSQAEMTAVDKLQKFIQSPPPIAQLVFRETLSSAPGEPGLHLAGSTNFQFYLASWQTNAFEIKQINSPAETNNLQLVGNDASRCGDQYWHLSPSGLAVGWQQPSPDIFGTQTTSNRSHNAVVHLYRILSRVLNMGIYNVPAGCLTWSNNTFHADAPSFGQSIEGVLHSGSTGRPEKIEVTYSGARSRHEYFVSYEFSTNVGLSYLPNRISVFKKMLGSNVLSDEFSILTIATNPAPAPRISFDPSLLIGFNSLERRYFSNNVLYKLSSDRKLVPTDWKPPVHVTHNPVPAAFYAFVSGLTALIFLLAMGRKRKATTNKTRDSYERNKSSTGRACG